LRNGPNATRLHFAYRRHEDKVEGDLRDFGIFQVGISTVQHRFLKLTHVNRFERVEDFNLGSDAAVFLGISTPALGGEDGTSWFFFLRGRRGLSLGQRHFLLGGATWSARHRNGDLENSLAVVRLDYINKHSRRWLFVGLAELQYGSDLDPEVQIRLGAESGLRGYAVRQFVGDRSLRMNFEERFFIADDVMQLVSVAVAAFFDTGYAWPEGGSLGLADLKSNLGLSLLLGRNRLSATTPGVRFDLAYALNPVAGQSRWLFSFGSKIAL
jgi:hemolysin activation/secretion protein